MSTHNRQGCLLRQDVRLVLGNDLLSSVVIESGEGVFLIDSGESVTHIDSVIKQLTFCKEMPLVVLAVGHVDDGFLKAVGTSAKQAGFNNKVQVYSADKLLSGCYSLVGCGFAEAALALRSDGFFSSNFKIFDIQVQLIDVSSKSRCELAIYLPEHGELIVGSIADELDLSDINCFRNSSLEELRQRIQAIDKLISCGAKSLFSFSATYVSGASVADRLIGLRDAAVFMRTKKFRLLRKTSLGEVHPRLFGLDANGDIPIH